MICQKCSFILSGSEDFCPHCGTPCKNKNAATQPEVVVTEQPIDDPPSIPIPKVRNSSHSAIFDTDEVYSHSKKEQEKPQKKSSSKAGISMFLMLFFVLLCIGAVVAMDYLGIVPAISFDRKETTDISQTTENQTVDPTKPLEDETQEGEKVFSESAGLVYPDINYKPSSAFISAQNGASLKKGPYENFAQICVLPYDSEVQVIGASSSNDVWVYVYAVEEDCYGWLSASFISTEKE